MTTLHFTTLNHLADQFNQLPAELRQTQDVRYYYAQLQHLPADAADYQKQMALDAFNKVLATVQTQQSRQKLLAHYQHLANQYEQLRKQWSWQRQTNLIYQDLKDHVSQLTTAELAPRVTAFATQLTADLKQQKAAALKRAASLIQHSQQLPATIQSKPALKSAQAALKQGLAARDFETIQQQNIILANILALTAKDITLPYMPQAVTSSEQPLVTEPKKSGTPGLGDLKSEIDTSPLYFMTPEDLAKDYPESDRG
ncbi:hypothetical protein ACNAN0_01000 [Agrilactobacillus fermenti]|uniref:hypothetical protein n=1 Tax=Agrilactobacillus fermenti TaxID=2586909 RepID=UPI003A5BA924